MEEVESLDRTEYERTLYLSWLFLTECYKRSHGCKRVVEEGFRDKGSGVGKRERGRDS